MREIVKSELGLVSKFPILKRCERCERPLEHSEYKGIKICYSRSRSNINGFWCIKCALSTKNKLSKPKVTLQDLDNYVSNRIYHYAAKVLS